jgi:hypothetical protein
MFKRGEVVVVNATVAEEVEEEIQILTLYQHQALSHCGETSRLSSDRSPYKAPSRCQRELLVDNSHQHPPQLLGHLRDPEIHPV